MNILRPSTWFSRGQEDGTLDALRYAHQYLQSTAAGAEEPPIVRQEVSIDFAYRNPLSFQADSTPDTSDMEPDDEDEEEEPPEREEDLREQLERAVTVAQADRHLTMEHPLGFIPGAMNTEYMAMYQRLRNEHARNMYQGIQAGNLGGMPRTATFFGHPIGNTTTPRAPSQEERITELEARVKSLEELLDRLVNAE